MFVKICKGCFVKASLISFVDIMTAEEFKNIDDRYNLGDETHVAAIRLMGDEENNVYSISEKEAIDLENQLNSLCANNSAPLTDYTLPWDE